MALSTGLTTSLIADDTLGTALSNAGTRDVDAVTDCEDETLLNSGETLGATFSDAWESGVDGMLDCTAMMLWTADEILAAVDVDAALDEVMTSGEAVCAS